MARFLKSREKAKGAAPGSLIFIGKKKMDSSRIRLFQYNTQNTKETEPENIEDALQQIDKQFINWLNIDGIHNSEIFDRIGKHFSISPLALENVLNTGQRAKFFEDKNSLTIISKAIDFDQDEKLISGEQISFILLENVLITFQERIGDHFEPVRQRLRNSIGRIRQSSADFLMYALLDCLVDNYMINIEKLGSMVEQMEEKIYHPTKAQSIELFGYKTEFTYFRKSIKPLKEVFTRLLRCQSSLIKQDNLVFFQEIYDIQEQAIDAVENFYGLTNDLINLYNSNLSNKVNDVMKVLTIFASIFIPLTFIAGIYGTNFEYVPELHFKYSYFIMWGVMIIIAAIMLYYFRKNKWF